MSVSVCACTTAGVSARMSPPNTLPHPHLPHHQDYSSDVKKNIYPNKIKANWTRRARRGCSRTCAREPVQRLSAGIWSVCARGADVCDAAGDSPLVRLLLSMYIAQQNTNPVIKENVGAGRERLSRSTAAEETGSQPRTRTHIHTGTHRTGSDSQTHRQTDGPDRPQTCRLLLRDG